MCYESPSVENNKLNYDKIKYLDKLDGLVPATLP